MKYFTALAERAEFTKKIDDNKNKYFEFLVGIQGTDLVE